MDDGEAVENGKQNRRGYAKDGLKKEPRWLFILLIHYVVPLLHVLIGIGNDLLNRFWDWVNNEVESIDHQEVHTRRAAQRAAHRIIDTITERDNWDDTPDGVLLKQLKEEMRYYRGLLRYHGARVQVAASKAAEEQREAAKDVGVR